jgi:hypothetical protein
VSGRHRQVAVVDEVRDSNTVGDDVNQGALTEILGQPPSAENRPSGVVALGRVAAMAFGLAQEKLIEPNAVPDELVGDMFALIYAGHVARAQR